MVWRKGEVPDAWKEAEGIFTPKKRNSKSVNHQFRLISLLNVEGKIFFPILARTLTLFLTANKYINTSVQKGGVSGFSSCAEHISAITQLIREAGKKDLTVVWLDLADAYGSISHQLIYTALTLYHVHSHVQKIITSYLDGTKFRFSVGDQLTCWQKLENRIVTGCTVSLRETREQPKTVRDTFAIHPRVHGRSHPHYNHPCTGKMDVDSPDRCHIMGQDEVQGRKVQISDHQELNTAIDIVTTEPKG